MLSSSIETVVASHLGRTFPAAAIVVRRSGAEHYARAFGWLDPEARTQPASLETSFDLASVTKLFAATAFMTYVDEGRVSLDLPVCVLLPEFSGDRLIAPYPDPQAPGSFVTVSPDIGATADASRVTFRHLLAHDSGLPAWLPLYREGSRARAYDAALRTPFAYPTGTHSVYSDIGLILLGLALERLAGQPLDAVVRERVTAPLGLDGIAYNPGDPSNIAPAEFCAWRQRRVHGEVHDENAAGLDGISAHAGLFANARDLAAFGELFLRRGAPLLRSETVQAMTQLQSEEGNIRRGLGFALWSPDPEASIHPLSPDSFGHTGFTGTGLWIDPRRELVCVALTNRVYYGRANPDATGAFRVSLNAALAAECQLVHASSISAANIAGLSS